VSFPQFIPHFSVAILICALLGCQAGNRSGDTTGTVVTNLNREFLKRTAGMEVLEKDAPRARMDVLQRLLDKSAVRDREKLVAWLRQTPTRAETDFDDLLTQAFVERFLKSGDVSALQDLLEYRCPNHVVLWPTEALLAESRHADAFPALFNAYKAAKTPAAAEALLGCLDCAFPSIRKPDQTDDEFVAACAAWYKHNRARCRLNENYPYFVSQPAGYSGPRDLFLLSLNGEEIIKH